MTVWDVHMKDAKSKSESPSAGENASMPATLSRRSMLRLGATAMPVVLTLQSGEALARTSNLISAAPGAKDGDDVLCLNVTNAPTYGSKYDLEWGSDYTRLRTRTESFKDVTYHPLVDGGQADEMGLLANQACETGGSFRVKPGSCTVNLPNTNIVVSSSAFMSVGGRVPITENLNIC